MVFRLHDKDIHFPDPLLANDDGLLAVGGDLSVPRLLEAYRNGIFPWFVEDGLVYWYSPKMRFVLYPGNLKTGKSMRGAMRKFSVTFDRCFEQVIAACASVPRRDGQGTWISGEMQQAYIELHRAGYAHSVETWLDDELAGGLYGVSVNGVFCGESMFSNSSNASKTALAWLCGSGLFRLIDCQVQSDHLERLGAELIPAARFLGELQIDDL